MLREKSWVELYFELDNIHKSSTITDKYLRKIVKLALEHNWTNIRYKCALILANRDDDFVIDGLCELVAREESVTIRERCIPALVKKLKH